ncbi:MAG: putative quinol monooxygenase [Gammaproteobacteria bacterium]
MSQETLRVITRLRAQKGKELELRQLLEGLLEPTRAEEGCLSYELLENSEDPCEFAFIEEWRDEGAFQAHFETEHVKAALAPEVLDDELNLSRYRQIG